MPVVRPRVGVRAGRRLPAMVPYARKINRCDDVTDDSHGYARLQQALEVIADQLDGLGQAELGDRIRSAMRFYGTGSPSEYVGEAKLALHDVVAGGSSLPGELRDTIAVQLDLIQQGHDAVGGA